MNRIIDFHDVIDEHWLEGVLLYLKGRYRMISAAELESYIRHGGGKSDFCHITADDGDKTFYDIIYPLLRKHNIPATLFVSPDVISEQSNFWFQEVREFNELNLRKVIAEYSGVSPEQLRRFHIMHIFKSFRLSQIKEIIEIYKSNDISPNIEPMNINISQILEINDSGLVSIGAHTLNHPVLANEDDITCENEINLSFKLLHDLLGCEIKYFAYPNGIPGLDFGDREKDILKKAGCTLAFSTFHGVTNQKTDPLSIPRYYVSKGNIFSIRVKLLAGRYWDVVRGLRTKSEERSRAELKALLNVTHNE